LGSRSANREANHFPRWWIESQANFYSDKGENVVTLTEDGFVHEWTENRRRAICQQSSKPGAFVTHARNGDLMPARPGDLNRWDKETGKPVYGEALDWMATVA